MRRGALWLAGLVLAGAPALALVVSEIAALSQLERGRWQISESDPRKPPRFICLRDPMLLVQVEHGPASCTRRVTESGKSGTTVQYRCAGHGFGHTRVVVETPRIARIDTQGIVDGRPFAWRAEARRVGAC
ncbi:MAG: DUF3617 domain-containing protein [Allosphingosinicella sp.]